MFPFVSHGPFNPEINVVLRTSLEAMRAHQEIGQMVQSKLRRVFSVSEWWI